MYIKKNTRVTFRSNRRSNFKRNNNFSNNKSRNKGNVSQQYNKYLKLAKEAFSSGDRVQSEYCYQFTDHYYRLMLELGISLEENDLEENKPTENNVEENNNDNDIIIEEKKDGLEDDNNEIAQDNSEDLASIESIPFISKPIKKKTSRSKKASV